MKYVKFFMTLLLSVVIFTLTACSKTGQDDFADGLAPELTLAEHIIAKTEFSEYDGNVEDIGMVITNNGDEDWGYETSFLLQKFDNDMGGWRTINFSKEMIWDYSAPGILPDCTVTVTLPLKGNFVQPFLPGKYRVVKYGDFDKAISAEFTIK